MVMQAEHVKSVRIRLLFLLGIGRYLVSMLFTGPVAGNFYEVRLFFKVYDEVISLTSNKV